MLRAALALALAASAPALAAAPPTTVPPTTVPPTTVPAAPPTPAQPATTAAACTCVDLAWLIRINDDNAGGAVLSAEERDLYAQLVARCDPTQEIAQRKKPPTIACPPLSVVPSSGGEPPNDDNPPQPAGKRRRLARARAATYPLPVEYFRIQAENDAFVGSGDAYYTNGLALETRFDAGPWLQSRTPWPASWRQRLLNVQWTVGAAQLLYTPTRIDQIDVAALRRERAYAAWLHGDLGLDYHFAGSLLGSSVPGASRLALLTQWGPVGKSALGYEIQSNWHSLYRDVKGCNRADATCSPVEPRGWTLNYTDGFFGFNARLLAESELGVSLPWRWGAAKLGSNLGVRLAHGVSADVGNVFVQGGGSLRLRAGLIGVNMASVGHTGPIGIGPTLTRPAGSHTVDSEDEPAVEPRGTRAHTPDTPANLALQHDTAEPLGPSEPITFSDPPWPFELFLFGGLSGRAVAYNALIDGDTCTDDPALGITTCGNSRVSSRTFVGDVEVGAALRLRFIELAFASVWRSAELSWPSPGAVQHEFGVVRVTFLYR